MRKQYSTVAVYNLALSRLGGEQLSTVESMWEDSTLGILCQNNFTLVLDSALAEHDWSFAIRRATLSPKVDDHPHPVYPYRYGLPDDCIKAGELIGESEGGRFVIEGLDLLTWSSPAILSYVARVEDPALWPPDFATALSWSLAAVLSPARNNDHRIQDYCHKMYESALAKAVANDLNKQRPNPPASKWEAARFGLGTGEN